MALYKVLKAVAFTKGEESAQIAMPGAVVDIDDVEFAAALGDHVELVEEITGDGSGEALPPIDDVEVELADPAPSGDKPSAESTNAELVDYLVTRGVKRATVENLTKPKLLDAIERLTHSNDDD